MTRQELTLVVLAAGMGSRFGGPKQIEAVGPYDEIILDYSVYDALAAGFSRVVFVVRDEVEAVLRRRLDAPLAGRCDVAYVLQRLDDVPNEFSVPSSRVRPWGTGQAVLACRGAVRGPFAVVNADDFYGAEAFKTLARFLSSGDGAASERNALVGYALGATLTEHGTVSRGICEVDAGGRLASIIERHGVGQRGAEVGYQDDVGGWHALARDACASMNFWGLDPSLFPLLEREFRSFLGASPNDKEEFRLPTAVGALLATQEAAVRVLRTTAPWLGVTHREDLVWVRKRVSDRVNAGDYPSPIWGERRIDDRP
jgi:NDP-sugar pyrophosphorylase family protein